MEKVVSERSRSQRGEGTEKECAQTYLGIRTVSSSRVDHQSATEETDAETSELWKLRSRMRLA
jgi:hypothetical protein